jgi:hypothetical protein
MKPAIVALFVAIAVCLRIGFHWWRPVATGTQTWIYSLLIAAIVCILVSHRKGKRSPSDSVDSYSGDSSGHGHGHGGGDHGGDGGGGGHH